MYVVAHYHDDVIVGEFIVDEVDEAWEKRKTKREEGIEEGREW